MQQNYDESKAAITSELVESHGINKDEYKKILNLLDRKPSITELGIFSAMWNEHCSYKSSKKWLRTLPTEGEHVICGPGENAGIVDIGDGQAVVFKMESHNHPSFIEPYQGAATGIGGILRDVFTMGARPIATMNSLSFGEVKQKKTQSLINGVVSGIAGYGNCFGVPNVGGELRFDETYNGNCLVNAFAAGLVDKNRIFYSVASGIGMPVVYLGAKTGRDGVGGASMASSEFDEFTDDKRPNVQVGDPFTEKRLMEACLELMRTGAIISIQDMGAAGLTCSAVEMGDKGNLGIEINLEKVPVRESNMTAYEMMLSESQERMLMVLKPEKELEAKRIFKKWDLDFSIIGQTIKNDQFIVKFNGKIMADLPLKALSGSAPEYDRVWTTPTVSKENKIFPKLSPLKCLEAMLKSENFCSRRAIWEQYDHMILSNTVIGPGQDSAIVKIEGTDKALAFTSDVNPRYCAANPFKGGKQAVAEAFRNLIASGATPLAITDNLNFGNPEKPEIMGQLVNCIKGISQASLTLDMPVVSGNVSLYNETNGIAISPTPTIGAVGILKNFRNAIRMEPQNNEMLFILGNTRGHLAQSAIRYELLGDKSGDSPDVDLELEKLSGKFILEASASGLINAVHDVSEGGIAIAAAEMAIRGNIGIKLISGSVAWYFGEDQNRYLISCTKKQKKPLLTLASRRNLKITEIGQVGGSHMIMGDEKILLDSLTEVYSAGLSSIFSN